MSAESPDSPEPLQPSKGEELRPWRLIPLSLSPPRFTKPPRILLHEHDRCEGIPHPRYTWLRQPLPIPCSPLKNERRHAAIQINIATSEFGCQFQPMITEHTCKADQHWETLEIFSIASQMEKVLSTPPSSLVFEALSSKQISNGWNLITTTPRLF